MTGFRVLQIDHVELFVPDRHEAADWYQRTLGHQDRPVTPESVVDHQKAYSVYFSDPYGHRLEVTTYDHDATRTALPGLRTPVR